MSVHVDIQIGPGQARRRLSISRVTNIDAVMPLDKMQDMVSTYTVLCTNGGKNQTRASFEHRYGDDVTVLIAKAGEAIRAKLGKPTI